MDFSQTLDKLTELATQLTDKIVATSDKYGPAVVDSILWVVRLNILSDMVIAVILAIVAVVVYFKMHKPCWAWAKKAMRGNEHELHPGHFFGPTATFLGSIIPAIIATATLLNVWNYVGLVKPELYIAKQVMDKVLAPVKEKKQ